MEECISIGISLRAMSDIVIELSQCITCSLKHVTNTHDQTCVIKDTLMTRIKLATTVELKHCQQPHK